MLDEELYVDNSAYQKKSTLQVISNYGIFLESTGKPETIMDVGCGDGFVTEHILKPFLSNNDGEYTLHAVDVNKKFIDHARRNHGNANITFDVMDVNSREDTSKYANGVDKIFSFQCLHWCPDMRIGIENVGNMLKTGGSLFATLSCSLNPVSVIFKELLSTKWQTYIEGDVKETFYSPLLQLESPDVWLRAILEEFNFDVIVCKVIVDDFTFSDFEQLKGFLLVVRGMCDHLSPQLQDEFFEELKIATQEKNKSLTFPCGYILVVAKKM